MFAVIKTGGKQHRVAADDVITVGKLEGDAGAKITFGEILAIGSGDDISIGAPFVSGASVAAEIVEHARGEKVIAFKKRRRQNSKRKRGHRQDYTIVKIVGLSGGGSKSDAKN
jgi:large subunit ribosomal protein L21